MLVTGGILKAAHLPVLRQRCRARPEPGGWGLHVPWELCTTVTQEGHGTVNLLWACRTTGCAGCPGTLHGLSWTELVTMCLSAVSLQSQDVAKAAPALHPALAPLSSTLFSPFEVPI